MTLVARMTMTGGGSGGGGTGTGTSAPPTNGCLTGMPPKIFTGERATSTKFLQQFEMYRAINEDVSIMQEPAKRVITFLSYIHAHSSMIG